MHTGIDIAAPKGTPIYATGDGVVLGAGRESGYGITCQINHGYGYQTLYGHLSKLNVRPGQKVKRGEIIGFVGSTGLSKAPHVHYEVILNGQKVNPVYFFYNDLSPSEYEEVIEKANEENQCLS
jgi:murein DD-endopeptidase MepM/ murein hydrolase activator NlpD